MHLTGQDPNGASLALFLRVSWHYGNQGGISRRIKRVKVCKGTHFVAPYFKLDTSER